MHIHVNRMQRYHHQYTNMRDLYTKLDVKYCYMYIEHVIDSVTGHARTTASDICAA